MPAFTERRAIITNVHGWFIYQKHINPSTTQNKERKKKVSTRTIQYNTKTSRIRQKTLPALPREHGKEVLD